MRFLCLGYIEDNKWESLSESEQNEMVEECFAYDDELRAGGHFAGGEALQAASSAVTLRWQNGKVAVTDGPYAETKEQIGGILILEARDMNEAVELMTKHPGVRLGGPFEIRPADEEFNKFIEARSSAAKA
jgi:hypothetical protein